MILLHLLQPMISLRTVLKGLLMYLKPLPILLLGLIHNLINLPLDHPHLLQLRLRQLPTLYLPNVALLDLVEHIQQVHRRELYEDF